jgi:FAD/FMN-containing dehydrogenase
MAVTWTNWVGNQTFEAQEIFAPKDEAGAVAAIKRAAAAGQHVRVPATGHSFTPIVQTDGMLLDLEALKGLRSIDLEKKRATLGAGTPISEIGAPLWEKGLALRNQGDIEAQRIAGAIATGTHGSGTKFGSFSASMTACRLVTASGDVLEVDESTPELLAAAQVSVGMLGAMTDVELQVKETYRLKESFGNEPFEDVMSNFYDRVEQHRNFGLFWFPSEESAALYNIEMPHGERATDMCHVKVFEEVTADEPDSNIPHHRVDRSYLIYPMIYDPNFHELEYFVPLNKGVDAIRELREFMLKNLPISVFPMEVRTVGADNAYLSSQYQTDTMVISVSGMPGTEYWDYLRAVDALLGKYDARVHWGKLHFLTKDQLLARYPMAEEFIKIRRELDPNGMFLNDHLRPLFA